MPKTNTERKSPKGNVRFSISLSDEQKKAKSLILERPFNFIVGKAAFVENIPPMSLVFFRWSLVWRMRRQDQEHLRVMRQTNP